jgi:N-acetylglucosaminyldiphosphoundecaprenol N-acetyl-beta-D-mannosaminyltransferase
MSYSDRSSVAVLGVPFDNVSMDEALALLEEKINEEGFHQIATANVDFLMHSIRDKELQEILCSCDLVVPDGMPIVWAARLMGMRLKERVSGVDLVPRLAALAAERGYGMYLLGATEQSSRQAAEFLKQSFPSLRIVGRYSPPRSSLAEMDHEAILSRIERAKPEILLVAMGNPKQEKWLAMHRNRLRVPLCMGVGGSLDFLAGTVSRAPLWMQRSGLEWLHRVLQEPSRLAKRYLNDAAGLAMHLPPQVAVSATQPRKPLASALQVHDVGSALVIAINGDLSAPLLTQFDHHARRASSDGRHVILDLAGLAYLGPDSLGTLVHLMTTMRQRKRQLWLADLPGHVQRVLRTGRLAHYFTITPSVSDAIYRIEKAERLLPAELDAIRSVSPAARSMVNVQVELLQEMCERIGSVAGNPDLSFGGFTAKTSAGR